MDSKEPGFDEWMKARRQLAAERSNPDAVQSNDKSRAAAQAAILINGGAASAVLAFISASISKDRFDPRIMTYAAIALGLYAVGVALGAVMIGCMNHALKHWSRSWQRVMENPASEVAGTKEHKHARPWYFPANGTFSVSILAFFRSKLCVGLWFLYDTALHYRAEFAVQHLRGSATRHSSAVPLASTHR